MSKQREIIVEKIYDNLKSDKYTIGNYQRKGKILEVHITRGDD